MAYLRLRWEDDPSGWLCHYELVIPLDIFDVRREIYEGGKKVGTRTDMVLPMNGGPVRRMKNGGLPPCLNADGSYYYDRPFRDGVHAQWDSAQLGNIPIVVVALDETIITKPEEDDAET